MFDLSGTEYCLNPATASARSGAIQASEERHRAGRPDAAAGASASRSCPVQEDLLQPQGKAS